MAENKKLDTDLLLSALEQTSSYADFISENKDSMGVDPLKVALRKLSAKLAMTPLEIMENAMLERAYGYQIFNGTRKPSRDKLIQLAIGMQLSREESDYLLKCGQKLPLYAKSERDAIIIYSLTHKLNLIDTNALLMENDQQTI